MRSLTSVSVWVFSFLPSAKDRWIFRNSVFCKPEMPPNTAKKDRSELDSDSSSQSCLLIDLSTPRFPEERERQGIHPHTSTIPKDRQARAHHSPYVSYTRSVMPARLLREQVGALFVCAVCFFGFVIPTATATNQTHGAKAPLQPLCTPRTHTLRRRGGQGLSGALIVRAESPCKQIVLCLSRAECARLCCVTQTAMSQGRNQDQDRSARMHPIEFIMGMHMYKGTRPARAGSVLSPRVQQ